MTDPQTVEAVLRDEIERLKTANKKLKKKAALANQDKLAYKRLYKQTFSMLNYAIRIPGVRQVMPSYVDIDYDRKMKRRSESQGGFFTP